MDLVIKSKEEEIRQIPLVEFGRCGRGLFN